MTAWLLSCLAVIIIPSSEAAATATAPVIPACGRYGRNLTEGSIWQILRRPYNSGIPLWEAEPAIIWLVCNEQEVLNALREASQYQLGISVRSGGHNVEGYSTYAPRNSGQQRMLIDTYHMKTLQFHAPFVSVGAGIKVTELNQFLAKQSPPSILPLTECGSVGVTGSALGGGYGMTSRKQGLTADNIVGMRVAVIQHGGMPELIEVSAAKHPDLFWALRGAGGGNFGVVTQLTFRTTPIPPVVAYLKGESIDPARAREAAEFAVSAPNELLFSISAFPGARPLEISGVYFGQPDNATVTKLQSFGVRDIQTYTPDQARVWGSRVSFCDNNDAKCTRSAADVPYFEKRSFKRKAVFVQTIDEAVRMIELMRNESSDIDFIDFTAFNGQVSAIGETDTAFVHRRVLFLVMMFKFWPANATDQQGDNFRFSMKRFHDKVRAIVPRTVGYPNFIDRDHLNEDWMTIFYGQNAPRLHQVKQAYDPQNLFSFPMSIPLLPLPPTNIDPATVPGIPSSGPIATGSPPVFPGNNGLSPFTFGGIPLPQTVQIGARTTPPANPVSAPSPYDLGAEAIPGFPRPATSPVQPNPFQRQLGPLLNPGEIFKPLRGLNGQIYTLAQLLPNSGQPSVFVPPVSPLLSPVGLPNANNQSTALDFFNRMPIDCNQWTAPAVVEAYSRRIVAEMNCYRDLHKLTNRLTVSSDWQRNLDAANAAVEVNNVLALDLSPQHFASRIVPAAYQGFTVFVTDRPIKAEDLVDHLYKNATNRQLVSDGLNTSPAIPDERIWQLIVHPELVSIGVAVACSPLLGRLYLAIHYRIAPTGALEIPPARKVTMQAKKDHLIARLTNAGVGACDINM